MAHATAFEGVSRNASIALSQIFPFAGGSGRWRQ